MDCGSLTPMLPDRGHSRRGRTASEVCFPATAAFFDLDKTLIARSSTLAFGRSFYQHGLLSRTDMLRGAVAQLRYRLSGADHRQMEKLRAQACAACQGWPADRVTEIVSRYLKDLILPYVYAEARALLSEHRSAGQDVIIVSTSGQEVVAPIGALLGAESVIATRMRIANGHYTGEMECLRLRRGEGRPGPPARRRARVLAARLLRLQRFGHRPAPAGGRRVPAGGQPRPRTPPDRHGTGVAGALVQHR